MKLVSKLFVQIFALFSSYFISIDADTIIPSGTLFFSSAPPPLLSGEFFVSPLHLLLNKVRQLSVAMAGERVLSTGYSLSRKMYEWIHHLYYLQAYCRAYSTGGLWSFSVFFVYIFVFPLLLIRDLVHETVAFMEHLLS